MSYSTVRALFEKYQAKSIAGDIILLNSLIRTQAQNGDHTSPEDCEGLLLDLCPEYSELPAQERREIHAHTSKLGGTPQ